ncbi:MAG: hypothetical protein LBE08_06080 [Bifidobacteriaceae bacterium]|nr:hypothetical protein [Bifidobacteriaceae bacterium]
MNIETDLTDLTRPVAPARRAGALWCAAGLVAVAGVLAWGGECFAVSYLQEAASGLAASRGWVSGEVSASIDLDRVLADDPSGSVGVAVLPLTARQEAGATAMASDLVALTSWATVVVAVGNDLSANSADLSSQTVLEIANLAETASDDLEANLAQAVGGIGAALEEAAAQGGGGAGGETASSTDDAAAGRSAGSWVRTFFLVVALIILVPIAVTVGLIIFFVRRSRRRRAGPEVKVSKAVPDNVADYLVKLRTLRGRYLGIRPGSKPYTRAKAMVAHMGRIVADTSELFRRLARKGGTDQMAVAEVEYRDQLGKVVDVLGEDYYLDILMRPDLWDDPKQRAEAVEAAVTAFGQQIIENIKQVNASQDLRFQVSLDALARAKRDQANGLYDAPNERPEE